MKRNEFILENDILYRISEPKDNRKRKVTYKQLVIPTSLRSEILYSCHEDLFAGHLGFSKTLFRLQQRFYWPGMKKDVQYWISSCVDCASKKQPTTVNVGKLIPIPAPSEPFEIVGVDVIGNFAPTNNGNRCILVFTDYLTKWPEAFPMPNQEANTIAKIFVEQIICRHGAPMKLISDRGKVFLSEVMEQVYRIMNVKKLTTSAYHPQTDGMTERFNKTLVNILSMYVDSRQKDWDEYIPFALFAYRTSCHTTTHEIPFYGIYGREPRLPIDVALRPLEGEQNDTGNSKRNYVSILKE